MSIRIHTVVLYLAWVSSGILCTGAWCALDDSSESLVAVQDAMFKSCHEITHVGTSALQDLSPMKLSMPSATLNDTAPGQTPVAGAPEDCVDMDWQHEGDPDSRETGIVDDEPELLDKPDDYPGETTKQGVGTRIYTSLVDMAKYVNFYKKSQNA
jgi:hypothetical protein